MGRFLKGCKPGPGRKRIPRREQYLKAAEEAITPEDLEFLVRNTLHRALKGDNAARNWIGKYYFDGKNHLPPQPAPSEPTKTQPTPTPR
ncbi:hypothetical protein N9N28_15835 [Rubripirellula amarantea]|nr:hypothetical protein [Rubripirellula amarantea]